MSQIKGRMLPLRVFDFEFGLVLSKGVHWPLLSTPKLEAFVYLWLKAQGCIIRLWPLGPEYLTRRISREVSKRMWLSRPGNKHCILVVIWVLRTQNPQYNNASKWVISWPAPGNLWVRFKGCVSISGQCLVSLFYLFLLKKNPCICFVQSSISQWTSTWLGPAHNWGKKVYDFITHLFDKCSYLWNRLHAYETLSSGKADHKTEAFVEIVLI